MDSVSQIIDDFKYLKLSFIDVILFKGKHKKKITILEHFKNGGDESLIKGGRIRKITRSGHFGISILFRVYESKITCQQK